MRERMGAAMSRGWARRRGQGERWEAWGPLHDDRPIQRQSTVAFITVVAPLIVYPLPV